MSRIVGFDEEALVGRLSPLPRPYVQLFAASCAEALQQAYQDFCATTGQGDVKRLGAALDLAWNAAITAPDQTRLVAALRESEELVPEEDDSWVEASANAQAAAAAVFYALRYAQEEDLEHAVAAAEQEYQAVDQAVLYEIDAEEFTPELEHAVLADPRVQAVLLGQRQRLEVVEDAARDGVPVTDAAKRLKGRMWDRNPIGR